VNANCYLSNILCSQRLEPPGRARWALHKSPPFFFNKAKKKEVCVLPEGKTSETNLHEVS
jgi:hypothetical protein